MAIPAFYCFLIGGLPPSRRRSRRGKNVLQRESP